MINNRVSDAISVYFIFALTSLNQWAFLISPPKGSLNEFFRIFGVSPIAYLGLIILTYLVATSLKLQLRKQYGIAIFILFYIIYGLLGSVTNNYRIIVIAHDLQLLIYFFINYYIIRFLSLKQIKHIIKWSIRSFILIILFSIITGYRSEYHIIGFIPLPVIAVMFPGLFLYYSYLFKTKERYFFYFVLLLTFIIDSGYLLSGKFILINGIFFVSFIYNLIKNSKFSIENIIIYTLFFLGALYFAPLLNIYFNQNFMFVDRIDQIMLMFNIFEIDLYAIAQTKNSLGNLMAEFLTLLYNLYLHPLTIFIGQGFGAGIQDSLYLLQPWIENGAGYSGPKILNNYFHGLHLPIYDIVLTFGIVGIFFLYFFLFKTSGFRLNLPLVLILIFYIFVNKEFISLFLILLYFENLQIQQFKK